MHDHRQYVDEYVSQLSGARADDAWHSLVEAGPAAMPQLIAAYTRADEPHVKVALVSVISEWRNADAVPFLAAQLQDTNPEIWKAALDGLVTVGGPTVVDALRAARAQSPPARMAWIDEAIEQVADSSD